MLQFGVCPEYVLDRMETYEIRALLAHSHLRSREDWERSRMLGFIAANASGAKLKKVTDLITFPWEGEGLPAHEDLTEEQMGQKWEECAMVAEMLTRIKNNRQ